MPSMYDEQTTQRLAELRAKTWNNTATIQEMQEALDLLRAGRTAYIPRPKAASKEKKVASGNAVLAEMDQLFGGKKA